MNKKILMLGGLVVAAALTLNCKKPDAAAATGSVTVAGDAKAAIASINKAMSDAAGQLESAADGAAAAKIINGVMALWDASAAKYPELKEVDKHPELKAERDKDGEGAMKFLMAVATVSEKYKDNAELKAAGDKMVTIGK